MLRPTYWGCGRTVGKLGHGPFTAHSLRHLHLDVRRLEKCTYGNILKVRSRRNASGNIATRAYVLVNNRSEGNAPLTVQALSNLLRATKFVTRLMTNARFGISSRPTVQPALTTLTQQRRLNGSSPFAL